MIKISASLKVAACLKSSIDFSSRKSFHYRSENTKVTVFSNTAPNIMKNLILHETKTSNARERTFFKSKIKIIKELMKASIEKLIARPSDHPNEEKVGIYLRQTERHFK